MLRSWSFPSARYILTESSRRAVRHAVQAQQGGGLLELQAVGERRLRDRLRVQHASLRSYEAVRAADGADHWYHRLRNCRAAAQAQATPAQSDRRGPEGRSDRGESAGGDRRRKGRPRRRDHHHPPVSEPGRQIAVVSSVRSRRFPASPLVGEEPVSETTAHGEPEIERSR